MSKITPITAAALAAGISYYGITGPYRPLVLLALPLLCFLGTLAGGPPCAYPNRQAFRSFRLIRRYGMAAFAGWCLGLSAGTEKPLCLGLPDQAVAGLQGVLQDDPRNGHYGGGRGTLKLSGAAGLGGVRTSAQGVIPVDFREEALPRLREFGRDCGLYLEGVIHSDGNVRRFRAYSAHIVKPPPRLEQIRSGIRGYILRRFTGPVWGGLASALLLGVRDALDTDLAKSYRDAGCSHVLALSGMHLAVIAGLIAFLLKKPLGLKAAGVIGVVCVIGYAYLAGNLPSLHRAGIMYVLGTLAVLGSLPKPPLPLLAMTFLIQLCRDPESGRSVSFMLSYLSLLGILTIGDSICDCLRGHLPSALSRPLSASLGAFIATAPVSALCFGILRPVGIIAGIIVVPLTTLFMICAILFLAADWAAPFFVPFLEGFLSVIYAILERLIGLGALAPGVSAGPGLVLLCAVGSAGVCIFLPQYKKRRKFAPFD
ncbi:MAG: ComEC/Rec2 family competence protein [Spirochaetaceae bacterium]|nr:ComEC/Rec2 family competence protein [Spirochaetaceae bacterium]